MVGVGGLQHIANEELLSRSGVKDIVEEMYNRKQRWAGYVARMKDNKSAKPIVEWVSHKKKRSFRARCYTGDRTLTAALKLIISGFKMKFSAAVENITVF
ncbi:unnamed protein product [Toxocara canis]|uniref:HA domain-containing protein n=1 Tax=Toxocara canis TaxID=6265 RepID=A0A183UJC0_TOXCA|nr:unnamed protein product [Toxocara canis]